MTIQGIDVSNNNGPIAWGRVAAAGITFAFLKASEGTTYADTTFAYNWEACQRAGIARGAYHYARPDANAATDEAAWFLHCVGPLQPGDVLALDLEAGTGDLSTWVATWLQFVEQTCGFRPLVYSTASFLTTHSCDTPTIAQSGLWLASWGVSAPTVPPPWELWAAWQYSDAGAVAGISGAVDQDLFNGTIDQLRAYGLPQPAPAPAPKTPTNDDLEELHRLVDAQPFDGYALVSYTQQFIVGGSV